MDMPIPEVFWIMGVIDGPRHLLRSSQVIVHNSMHVLQQCSSLHVLHIFSVYFVLHFSDFKTYASCINVMVITARTRYGISSLLFLNGTQNALYYIIDWYPVYSN